MQSFSVKMTHCNVEPFTVVTLALYEVEHEKASLAIHFLLMK